MVTFALSPEAALPPESPPPQAVSVRGSATAARAAANRIRNDGISSSFRLMLQDLAEKVFGAIALGIGEEFLRLGRFDDCSVGHEHHSVGRPSRETHFVGHH